MKCIQRRPNVLDAGPTLYKCYANILCLLGDYLAYPSRGRKSSGPGRMLSGSQTVGLPASRVNPENLSGPDGSEITC